jgi:hypothetical protein
VADGGDLLLQQHGSSVLTAKCQRYKTYAPVHTSPGLVTEASYQGKMGTSGCSSSIAWTLMSPVSSGSRRCRWVRSRMLAQLRTGKNSPQHAGGVRIHAQQNLGFDNKVELSASAFAPAFSCDTSSPPNGDGTVLHVWRHFSSQSFPVRDHPCSDPVAPRLGR